MSNISAWAKNALEQQKFINLNKLNGQAQITHTVSKSIKGDYRQDRIFTRCKSPEASQHMHFPGSFDCKSLISGECDSAFSRKHLTGSVGSRYDATFGHDDPFNKKEIHLNRGYFFGNFSLSRGIDKPYLKGSMSGLCNIGLNRDPFERVFEKCHNEGRWYGEVQAGVDLEGGERAFLIASLAMEIKYKPDPSWLGMEFIGNLEGMLIRECKEAD